MSKEDQHNQLNMEFKDIYMHQRPCSSRSQLAWRIKHICLQYHWGYVCNNS